MKAQCSLIGIGHIWHMLGQISFNDQPNFVNWQQSLPFYFLQIFCGKEQQPILSLFLHNYRRSAILLQRFPDGSNWKWCSHQYSYYQPEAEQGASRGSGECRFQLPARIFILGIHLFVLYWVHDCPSVITWILGVSLCNEISEMRIMHLE